MANLLKGVALVTGASSGIGQATAIALTRHGIKQLALLDIDPIGAKTTTELVKQQASDVDVLTIVTDMTNEESVVQGIQKVINYFGRIDYAVNNAGGALNSLCPSTDLSAADFRAVMDLNVTGLWIGQREEIKQMLKQEPLDHEGGIRNRGVIINMSSAYGIVGTAATTNTTAYSTSKHAVLGITKNDANRYIKDNIRINAICPGYVNTPAMAAAVTHSDVMKGELLRIPMGRLAEPDEIAQAIVFLASPMSSYMSGAGLVVDGGFTSV
ncbi:oxidoreductase [Xylogone sp. PMI_703]|nr:oxidoreductase [Xylogone sp. PMI_703]